MKIDFKQNVNLKATCLINKVTKNISQDQMNYVKSKKLNSKRLSWFNEGIKTDEFSSGKCPFCSKKLTVSKVAKFNKIVIFDAKPYEKINSISSIFQELKITIPDWLKKK